MIGFLNLNKPKGQTSRGLVDAVQRRLRRAKVGHCGTLDPLASGVLVVALGKATRLVEVIQELPKTYLAEIQLGATSITDDSEGPIQPVVNAVAPSTETLTDALGSFVGTFLQEPPAFSAIHLGKKRAYHLARKGHAIALPARPVTIHLIELLEYRWPCARLRVVCGKGTYLRSLARDLGKRLGCGGYIGELCRTAVGPFQVDAALSPPLEREQIQAALIPIPFVLGHLPTLSVSPEELKGLRHGAAVDRDRAFGSTSKRGVVHDKEEQALLIVELEPAGWVCRKRIPWFRPRPSSQSGWPTLPKPAEMP